MADFQGMRWLYVGDDVRDIEGGRAAGMTTVACAWGYGGQVEAASWGAHYLIDTPHALLDLIRGVVTQAPLAARAVARC